MIDLAVDADGVAVISWDMPDTSTNVLNEESMRAFADIAGKAIDDDAVTGIIITSGKRDFIAGADLEMLKRFAEGDVEPAEDFYRSSLEGDGMNATLRRLETCGKPVVSAINGTALGGGLEVCLACHHRIVADNPAVQLGLPEATLGLLPAGGGTQRLGRLIGWQKATDLLLSGKRMNPAKAKDTGIVDAVAPPGSLIDAAKRWIADNPEASQPWDRKDYVLPGAGFYDPAGQAAMTALITKVHSVTQGNQPAQLAILRCLHDGLRASMDAGLRIECREFYALLKDPVAGNMIRSLFFNMQKARKLDRRPEGIAKRQFKKVGVLGAGMMGAGIALVTAKAGIDVVLLDTSQELAERGKDYSETVLSKGGARGKTDEETKSATLARILPTTDYADLDGCDLVIEAVFEDRTIKADVTSKAEAAISDAAIFGTNTSTLPITGLAEASNRSGQFIGIHFFSPVDRMDLVEIICGEETSDRALAEALDYVQQIGKTPIIVNDSRGFYTSRVFGTYTREAMEMLREGVPASLIENLGRATGMPVPPLALLDEITLDLVLHVRRQTEDDLGPEFEREPIDDIVAEMVEKLDRPGRKAGKGFYDYDDGGKRIWPELHHHYPPIDAEFDAEELKNRLLFIQAVETARCVDEGVITDAGDADIGAILGWGFPAHTGGPLSLIDTIGAAQFVEDCDALAAKFGPRFKPPEILRSMAGSGDRFHRRAA